MKNAKQRSKAKARKQELAAPPPAPPKTGPRPWMYVLGLAVIAIVVFEAYQPAIGGPFLFDDNYLPFMDPHYDDASLRTWLVGVRPTLMFSFWLNNKWSGDSASSYHLLNVFFHLLNGFLVFMIVRRLLEWAGTDFWPREPVAAFAGAVFLLHPIQTEAVAYVASRSENLSVFFCYAAFAAFLYRRKQAISFLEAIVVGVLFGAAVTSKEHTAVLPVLLLLTDYYWNPGFSLRGIKRNWRLYAPVGLIGAAGFVFVFSKLAESDTAGFRVEGMPWYLYFITQCKAIWIYVRMTLLPFGQNIDHDYPLAESMLDPMGLLGMAGLMAAAVAAWIYRRRFPLASYGYFVFLLFLAPTSSVVPIKDILVERRLYLPMIGFLFIVVEFLRRWQPDRRILAGALSVAALALGLLTYQRSKVWAGPVELWEDSVAKSPENARAHFQLAYAYYEQHRCSEAIGQYERVAQLQEPDVRLLVDWALAYDCASRPADALVKLQEASQIEDSAHVFSLIGMMHAKQGQFEEALAALDEAEKRNRRFAMLYFYRGNVYRATGENDRAVAEYEKALKYNPELEGAHRALEAARRSANPAR